LQLGIGKCKSGLGGIHLGLCLGKIELRVTVI
jgi:hypothetical protein